MERQLAESLLLEAAPLADADGVVETPEKAWGILWEPDSSILVEWDAELPRFVLTADVCPLPVEDRPRFLEMLLAYNYLWNVHGGVRAALDDSRGMVSLMLDVPTEGLSAQLLAAVLSNMRAAVAAWRGVLQSSAGSTPGGAAGVEEMPGISAFGGSGFIRA